MSQYHRGRALEYLVTKIFRDQGFSVVRGAGSKGEFATPDGPFKVDLIATKTGSKNTDTIYVVLMQAKRKKK